MKKARRPSSGFTATYLFGDNEIIIESRFAELYKTDEKIGRYTHNIGDNLPFLRQTEPVIPVARTGLASSHPTRSQFCIVKRRS
ncbi:hypothetical protein QE152_g25402 [Popillia japonica]|uniref:Uncharacterized protein n=1 Tax=Popillia japonica TaxID=7064 RepID=A0AAW1K288_POPJA